VALNQGHPKVAEQETPVLVQVIPVQDGLEGLVELQTLEIKPPPVSHAHQVLFVPPKTFFISSLESFFRFFIEN
jgi:hypothetical protein